MQLSPLTFSLPLALPFLQEGSILFHGFLLALGLILPLGVQNLFIFQQGAAQQRLRGAAPAVITASVCDTLLIVLAVSGVSLLVLAHPMLGTLLMGGGSVFLLYMGWAAWTSPPSTDTVTASRATARKQIVFAASVSLLNPHAIMDTIGVIGTSSLQYQGGERWLFSAACIAVSWFWFFGLAWAGKLLGRLDQSGRIMLVMNRLSAIFIWIIAACLIRDVWISPQVAP